MSRSSAALTIVNALSTGVGCAVGIERFVTVRADTEPGPLDHLRCSPPEAATPLVRASVRAALATVAPGRSHRVQLEIRSEVPVAKGLKSSSAVATATVRAVARSAGRDPPVEEVARLAAQVGRSVGVSATGAFDDALAGLRSGFVLTDNRNDRLITSGVPDPSWTAVVLVPPGQHPPVPSQRTAFEQAVDEGAEAVREARAGRYSAAMRRNTVLVERLMGYDYAALRGRLDEAGAVAAGVSGLGPAVGVLVPRPRVARVLASLPGDMGEHFAVDLTRPGDP